MQEQLKRVIKMNKEKHTRVTEDGTVVDDDSLTIERLAKQALSLFPTPQPVVNKQ